MQDDSTSIRIPESSILTEREKAIRAAAFIDTDGFISINKSKADGKTNYVIRSGFITVTKVSADWLVENFGGSVFGHAPYSKDNLQRKYRWDWTISAKAAERFLESIHPFLIVKYKQAELALELRRFQGYKMADVPQPEKEALWKQFSDKMKELNR